MSCTYRKESLMNIFRNRFSRAVLASVAVAIPCAAAPAKPTIVLVHGAAFAPDAGESAASLSGKFHSSTLGGALAKPVALGNGANDLSIEQAKFHQQFAADLPAGKARLMAVGQRPITDAALNEGSPAAPAWKTVPSWFVYGKADKNIPAEASAFMAKRANAKKTVVIDSASHVVMTSHPDEVAALIEDAARTVK